MMVLARENMTRTQITLDRREYRFAKKYARALGISLAEFIRRAVREAFTADSRAPWMKFAGLVETGDPRSSLSINELVYGHSARPFSRP